MDSIVIKVSDLRQKVKQLTDDNMDYVKLYLMESEDEMPPCAFFSAISNSDEYEIIDYEEIDAVPAKIAKEFN